MKSSQREIKCNKKRKTENVDSVFTDHKLTQIINHNRDFDRDLMLVSPILDVCKSWEGRERIPSEARVTDTLQVLNKYMLTT